jgi:multicomponent Na+:H+ antiporter subunit B
MDKQFYSPIVLLGARLLSPYIFIFGMYVIFHGHYSPGGGFQGGALLAASVLLMRVAAGQQLASYQFKEKVSHPLGIIGVIIYFGTGLLAMTTGGYFLDYGSLPIPGVDPAWLRYTGILIIEIGIGAAVMAILVSLYDNIVKGEDYD